MSYKTCQLNLVDFARHMLNIPIILWHPNTVRRCMIQCGPSMMSWVDPYPFIELIHTIRFESIHTFFIEGMDRLNKRVWIDSRHHWRSTLYVAFWYLVWHLVSILIATSSMFSLYCDELEWPRRKKRLYALESFNFISEQICCTLPLIINCQSDKTSV